jgi:hypothetical protein
MLYPWPLDADEGLLDQALNIAMDYLELTGQAEPYEATRKRVGAVILAAYRRGARHPIRLSNEGRRAIENVEALGQLLTVYPRVS